jgi:hypothetical protein
VALARLEYQTGKTSEGRESVRRAVARCEEVRRVGPHRIVAEILPVYSDAAALLPRTEASEAIRLLEIQVLEHEKLLLADRESAPSLRDLSLTYSRLERLLEGDSDRLVAFYSRAAAFLDKERGRQDSAELASQGYALFQFRLGEVLFKEEKFRAAAEALASADEEYGKQVSTLVRSGHPMRDQARQRWAEAITLRALALAAPYLYAGGSSPLETDGVGRVALQGALAQARRGRGQLEILEQARRGNNRTREMSQVLEGLQDRINELLK